MKRALLVGLLALVAASCGGRQRVVTQPDVPLAPPTPPPRLVAPAEVEEPAPEAKPPEPARKPVRPPGRSEPAREQKPPVEPPKPVEKPEVTLPPKVQAPAPASTLQPGTQAELEREARRLLAQATNDRKNVDYRNLNSDAKGQYEQATRFMDQAQQALKEQNYVLAQRLAEKAATILGVLVGR